VVERYKDVDIPKFFRGDAAFAQPGVYVYLEAEHYQYVIRLPGNNLLREHVRHLLMRPVGRPPKKPVVRYHSFEYQAKSWDTPRRVIGKIQWHQSELFPRVNFVVTNLTWSPKKVVAFYNKRGLAEQWIKEGKYAVNWTRLSCHDFDDNQVRLQLLHAGVQPGQLLPPLGVARQREALDADDAAREADQDRGEDGAPCPVRDLSTGRGRHPATAVPSHP